jgi:drug/metabolite transporter (DMT)-like permease
VTGVIGARIPVVAGIVGGDRLDPLDVIGIALALLAIILVTRQRRTPGWAASAGPVGHGWRRPACSS